MIAAVALTAVVALAALPLINELARFNTWKLHNQKDPTMTGPCKATAPSWAN